MISPQCSLSPQATGLYLSSKGNLNTTKSFLYSFKVCKNKILFFPWSWMYGTFTYPAEELNPEWIQSLSAALIKCTAPALWGFLGLIQAWPLRHARQVGSSASELQPTWCLEGSMLTTPHPVSRAGVKNCLTALGFLNRGKCSNLRKKISGRPRELNPEPPLQTLLLYLSHWNVNKIVSPLD